MMYLLLRNYSNLSLILFKGIANEGVSTTSLLRMIALGEFRVIVACGMARETNNSEEFARDFES
jgi:hypothetical protein